ncbi:MAG: hypothetical protein DRP65_08395 [Planctomycetota bacterium]|nr:MAG: hypothetical protein DRP65_08395 [Planctomycetota bacterium]
MSRLKAIFPDDWQYILEVYRQAASPPGTEQFEDRLLLILLEISVKFGERLSNYLTSGFVEIGCGMAIPSLTLAKLGRPDVLAIDVDSEIIAKAEAIKEKVGCDLEIRCADVFKDRPKLQKGQMLIAEKPASYKKNTLEVEYNISNWCKIEGYNFAIIPMFLTTDTRGLYFQRCAKYEKKLRQTGFKVENKRVVNELPIRWLIATKW